MLAGVVEREWFKCLCSDDADVRAAKLIDKRHPRKSLAARRPTTRERLIISGT